MKKKLLTSIFIFLMQSYGVFLLIPRNLANSSSTFMDKRPNFGQIAKKRNKIVQRFIFSIFICIFTSRISRERGTADFSIDKKELPRT